MAIYICFNKLSEMNHSLKKSFDRIETQRKNLLSLLKDFSKEQFNNKPSPEKWSASHILSHLISAERLSVGYVKKKIQGAESADDSGLQEEIKMLLLTVSQRLPGLKFKAPKYVVEHTIIYSDLSILESEWQQVRKELSDLLESIPEKYINRKIYKHARVGYLNIQHAVMFFGEHVTHHTPQLKRLIDASR
jgi:uncharacterized damage-inducible protein DinB